MDPDGPLGRTIKPFIEDGLRQGIRSVVNEPWFREFMYVDNDASGNGRIHFGPKGRFGSLPLQSGIAALTALGGLAHVSIPGYPFLERLVNEMIDEVGSALKHAYENGRTPTADEIAAAQQKLKEALETPVRIVVDGGLYYIHHKECFYPPVITSRPQITRTYLAAAAMGARPTDDCPVCRNYLGELITRIESEQKERSMPQTPTRVSPADVLMQLADEVAIERLPDGTERRRIVRTAQQKRDAINNYITQWEAEDEKAAEYIDRLMLKLNTVFEAELLATARSLPEFKSLMRRTLEPKTAGKVALDAAKQAMEFIGQITKPENPDEPTILELELYRTQNRSGWRRIRDLFRIL